MGFMAIAPALLLVCVMSALRGFMQGQQNMVPTAVSQLIEQVGKVVIILPMAYYGMGVSASFAAAMVLLGNTIAEAVALLYIFIVYWRKKASFAARFQDESKPITGRKVLVRRLFSLSVPIALGSCIVPLAAFIDSGMIMNRLMNAGFSPAEGLALYGRYSGYVISLINVPTAFSIAIAMSLVPAISGAIARGDMENMRRQSALGIRFSFLVGLPCSIGMSMLSRQILSLVYSFSSPEALDITAQLLSLSSLTIVLFTVTQSTEGILQGLQKQRIPMYSLMAGVSVKILLNYTLIGIPSVHIYGAPVASIACYSIAMIPNLYYTRKHAKMKMNWKHTLMKPMIATTGMAAVLFVFMRILPDGRLWSCVLILLGIGAYLGFALLTGAMTKGDFLPMLKLFKLRNRAGV
jgi:stage V sporulation protein B